MSKSPPDKQEILDAIRETAQKLGHPPSRAEFNAKSGMTEYQVLKHFPSWREAVRASGLEPHLTNIKLDDSDLLQDWGELVRGNRQIPTRDQYRREGKYSPGVFESHFGPWSTVPAKFKDFARDKPAWADVLALLPVAAPKLPAGGGLRTARGSLREATSSVAAPRRQHAKLEGRPIYGNPVDFRGLRHEPVNEQGVVFLFGMVAKELGCLVEAVQSRFPDCEAKRYVGPDGISGQLKQRGYNGDMRVIRVRKLKNRRGRRIGLVDRLALLVATAGGIGNAPIAPGTVASFIALLVVWALPFSPLGLALTLLLVVAIGGWAADRVERLLATKDPGRVVIDEVAGMLLSVVALPRSFGLLLAAFLLFRLLDILKPFPIRQSESLPGGLAIMLDDLIAGAFTLALLWGLLAFLGRPA